MKGLCDKSSPPNYISKLFVKIVGIRGWRTKMEDREEWKCTVGRLRHATGYSIKNDVDYDRNKENQKPSY